MCKEHRKKQRRVLNGSQRETVRVKRNERRELSVGSSWHERGARDVSLGVRSMSWLSPPLPLSRGVVAHAPFGVRARTQRATCSLVRAGAHISCTLLGPADFLSPDRNYNKKTRLLVPLHMSLLSHRVSCPCRALLH